MTGVIFDLPCLCSLTLAKEEGYCRIQRMKENLLAVQDFKSKLRLTTITIFILFQLPGQLRFFFSKKKVYPENELEITLLFMFAITLFLVLEVLEYIKWNYRFDSALVPRVFFALRLLCVSALLMTDGIYFGHPGMSLYFTLLLFYSYYTVPFRLSLACSIIFPLTLFLFEFQRLDRLQSFSNYSLFFMAYRSIIMIIFYVFAYFWDKDRQISDENIRLVASLNRSEKQLREYAQRIGQTVALEERTRLARDIHDSLGHALTGIQIQLAKAEAYFSIEPDESRKAVGEAKEAAVQAIQDIRSSLDMLNDRNPKINLREEIPQLLHRLESAGVSCTLVVEGDDSGYNYAVQIALFRMVQEGITNILKHAEAKNVSLSFHFGEREVELVFEDDGRGFDPELPADQSEGHYGLQGLKQRLELVRGRMEIISAPGKGCILKASLPKNPVTLIGEEK